MNTLDDYDDYTLMTTESMAIVLNDDGCCVRHPNIKLKQYDKNGDVYLKESCPSCQREFQKAQHLLLEKRRELDRKLQELGEETPHDERHTDFCKMVTPDLQQENGRALSPTLPAVKPVQDLDALAAQMQHIQQMQDILTFQKDRELHELREKMEVLQADLTDKKIEIALLQERLSQQRQNYERELKVIQRAVAMDTQRREKDTAREIHIGELHVQVGSTDSSEIVQKTAAATLQAQLESGGDKVFFTDTSPGEQSTERPKTPPVDQEVERTSTKVESVEPSMETYSSSQAVMSEDSSNKSEDSSNAASAAMVGAAAVAGAVTVGATMSDSAPSLLSPVNRYESKGESVAVLPPEAQEEDSYFQTLEEEIESSYLESTYLSSTADEKPQAKVYLQERVVEKKEEPESEWTNYHEQDDEEPSEDEEKDEFDVSGHGPSPPVTSPPLTRKPTPYPYRKPGPLTTQQRGPPSNTNEHRKDPMKASMESLTPPHRITDVSEVHSSASPVEAVYTNNAPPIVPLDEQVTLPSFPSEPSDRFTPRVVNEEYTVAPSLGPTVASSTYGEDRHVVSNQLMLDPYGDRGTYSGVVLMSTNLPHGQGKMVYEDDGRTYDGDWKHGRWHGWGEATFSNGDRFEGWYRYDQRHGQGRYEWHDGRIYDGEFRDDKRDGKGHFIWPDGADYVGDFKDGQRDGYGVYIFSHNGGRYEGNWVNGRYEGYGECTWKDGRRYKVCRIRCMLGSGDVKSRADTVFFLQTRASGKRAWPTEKERKRTLTAESCIQDSGSRMSPCGTNFLF